MKSKRCVVVVDEDPRVSEAIRMLLESAQINTKLFATAEDFLALTDLGALICLITDVKMGGIALHQLHKRLLDRGIDIPIILISADPDDYQPNESNTHGALVFLQKPFDGEELLYWVRMAIKLAQES